MEFLRKTKKLITFRYISWLVYFIAFAGLLSISLTLLTDKCEDLITNSGTIGILLCVFAGLFGFNFVFQYATFKKNDQAFSEFSQSLSQVEKEIGASLDYEIPENLDMMTISALLNHSLQCLNEKNIRLKSELERNERLSENINEFYRQMRTLRDSDLIFDFFEYDITSSVFVFISGMITALADDETELTEITGQDLFKDYRFSISFEDFSGYVEKSISEDKDLYFECSVTGKEKRIHWLKFWGRPSKDKTRITGTISDITSEVHMRDLEKERAIHDNISGFYNRNALAEMAGKAMAECAEGEFVVFAYVGLTGYQDFQERFGMVAGNSYIRVCAEVFKKFLNDKIIPLRWWGSDFLFIVKGVRSLRVFRREAIAILNKLEKYIGEVDGIAVTFPTALGYAASGIHGSSPAELLEYASFAEHEVLREVAKSPNEFNRERFEDAHKASLRRTFIKDIIDRNQLSVVFQPIVSLKTGELFGFEALSRPMNPLYSSITELIDDAEASGHYVILEKRMVYNALDTYMERDPKYKDHYLFINTAPYATLDEKDYNDIRDRYFGHMKVVFEVIERNRMEPEEINIRKSIVTKAGAKFALDDFGSGYSNHLALLALEPDIIKIDRELVRKIDDDLRKQHMLEDIISYARYRGTRVLAEGVETQGELETLCRMGVDYAQGYFTGEPSATLSDPDPRAIRIIKSISHKNQIDMRQVYIIIEKSLAFVNEKLAKNLSITTFLMMKLGKRLGFDGDKIIGLIITSIFRDIGMLYPGCEEEQGSGNDISTHTVFSYLIFKEFSPYPEYARMLLYHHRKYHSDSVRGNNGIINNITIPDEAYLLYLAGTVAEVIMESDSANIGQKVASRIGENGFKPEYREAFEALCQDGILSMITSGEYRDDLLSYIKSIKISKAETESLIRTFIYAISFRSPFNFSHPRVMESTVNLLGRMTKQNWNLLEKVRAAALLYNLGMLTMNRETFEKEHSPDELHDLLHGSMVNINRILEEAELMDIVAMFKGAIGEKAVNGKHSLMGKDIISGSNMLNIADIFASLMEQRCSQYDISCMEILEELKSLAKTENLYFPMIELMEDYIEDIEARIKAIQAEFIKQYDNVISGFEKLKQVLISDNGSLS